MNRIAKFLDANDSVVLDQPGGIGIAQQDDEADKSFSKRKHANARDNCTGNKFAAEDHMQYGRARYYDPCPLRRNNGARKG